MITLTRIRQNTPFILNPDLIERVDTHVDTVVRLTSGTEYVVNETGDEIVRRTAEFRARVLALAGTMHISNDEPSASAPAAPPVAAPDVWAPSDSPVTSDPVTSPVTGGTPGEPDAEVESSHEEAAL